jgi:ADP-ribose pyrophosphatase YjhB (NUDIX family)
MAMSGWQRVRTRGHLFVSALRRRMTLGARVAVFDGDRVLLLRHSYVPDWHFPGGGVEPGETAAESGARETLEEAGIEPRGALGLVGLYHNRNEATVRDHVALYLCREFGVARPFRPNHEIAERSAGSAPMSCRPIPIRARRGGSPKSSAVPLRRHAGSRFTIAARLPCGRAIAAAFMVQKPLSKFHGRCP